MTINRDTQRPFAVDVQILQGEAPLPAGLIVLAREITRRGPFFQSDFHFLRVGEVLLAHRRRRNVHHIAPALLIFHRRHRVNDVAVPPDGIASVQRRDRTEGFDQQRVPLLRDRQHSARRDAAQLILRHIVKQRAQQHIGHRLGDWHHVQQSLTRDHIRQRGPALESAEHRALGGVVDSVLFHFSTVRGVPRIVSVDMTVKDVGEDLLVGGE